MPPHGGELTASHFQFIARGDARFKRASSIDRETQRQVSQRFRGDMETEVGADRRDALLQQLAPDDDREGDGVTLPLLALGKLSKEIQAHREGGAVKMVGLRRPQPLVQRFRSANRRAPPAAAIFTPGPDSSSEEDDDGRLRTASITAARLKLRGEGTWNADGLIPPEAMGRPGDAASPSHSYSNSSPHSTTASHLSHVQLPSQDLAHGPFVQHYQPELGRFTSSMRVAPVDTGSVPFVSPTVPKPIPSQPPMSSFASQGLLRKDRSVTFRQWGGEGAAALGKHGALKEVDSEGTRESVTSASASLASAEAKLQRREITLPRTISDVPMATSVQIGSATRFTPVHWSLSQGAVDALQSTSAAPASRLDAEQTLCASPGSSVTSPCASAGRGREPEPPAGPVLTRGVIVKYRRGLSPTSVPTVAPISPTRPRNASLFAVEALTPGQADASIPPRVIPGSARLPAAGAQPTPQVISATPAPQEASTPASNRGSGVGTPCKPTPPPGPAGGLRGRVQGPGAPAKGRRGREAGSDASRASVANPFQQGRGRQKRGTAKSVTQVEERGRGDPFENVINESFQKFLTEIYKGEEQSASRAQLARMPGRMPRSAQYQLLHPLSHIHEAEDVPGELLAWRALKSMTADAATATLRAAQEDKTKKESDERVGEEDKLAMLHPVQVAKFLAQKWYETPYDSADRSSTASALSQKTPPGSALASDPRGSVVQSDAVTSKAASSPPPPPPKPELAVPLKALSHPATKRTLALVARLDSVDDPASDDSDDDVANDPQKDHLRMMDRALLARRVLWRSVQEDDDDKELYKWTRMVPGEAGGASDLVLSENDVLEKKRHIFQQILQRRRLDEMMGSTR